VIDLGRVARPTSGGKAAVAASLRIDSPGANNDLIFTATTPGAAMNGLQISFVDSTRRSGTETATYTAGANPKLCFST